MKTEEIEGKILRTSRIWVCRPKGEAGRDLTSFLKTEEPHVFKVDVPGDIERAFIVFNPESMIFLFTSIGDELFDLIIQSPIMGTFYLNNGANQKKYKIVTKF